MANDGIRGNILSYASSDSSFTLSDVHSYLSRDGEVNRSTLRRQLSELVKERKLDRIGHGVYTLKKKPEFKPVLSELTKNIFTLVHGAYPLLKLCIYEGGNLSQLQHHLSPNQIIYVEVERDGVESVFNLLTGCSKLKTYIRPDEALIYNYINMGEQAIFVKPLITEAPLQMIEDIPSPTLEKLLVDIQRDPDFFYLQGHELLYIIDNAFTLYTINTTKLLRYASRRGTKQETISILEELNIMTMP